MKLNFRLPETQATTSMLLGLFCLAGLAALSVFVFYGLHTATGWIIYYNDAGTLGSLRRPLVYGTTAVTFLLGAAAVALGLSSVGEKRNHKQSRSWFGLVAGAIGMASAFVLGWAWQTLSEPIINTA